MKCKNGFTLVELLAVIIILGIIALIVYPTVNKSIKKAKENSYEKQVETIINSARQWGVRNSHLLPDINSSDVYCLDLATLKQNGYIKNADVVDPRNTKTNLQGEVKITYSTEYNQYEYNYLEDGCGI